ncbi:hypothetical protein TNCV_2876131 [Trichonephila clavipes]|nr:hypothetical protein TNCV_2876131 [Trichonephila clavipes]
MTLRKSQLPTWGVIDRIGNCCDNRHRVESMAALVSEYTLEFFTLLNARSKKELIEWCMKEGLIASSYECPKCNEQMGLNERELFWMDLNGDVEKKV